MRAAFNDAPALENQDFVGATLEQRGLMGDEQHAPLRHHVIEGSEHRAFGLCIEIFRGLVEQQDRCVFESVQNP